MSGIFPHPSEAGWVVVGVLPYVWSPGAGPALWSPGLYYSLGRLYWSDPLANSWVGVLFCLKETVLSSIPNNTLWCGHPSRQHSALDAG